MNIGLALRVPNGLESPLTVNVWHTLGVPIGDRLRRLIGRTQCLYYLVPAKPLVLWSNVPADGTEYGNSPKDHTGLRDKLNLSKIHERQMDVRS